MSATWYKTVLHIVSNGIIFFGFYIMYKGWMLIYKTSRCRPTRTIDASSGRPSALREINRLREPL